MIKVKKYSCGNGEGMFEHKNGHYVEKRDYYKLKDYLDELFELASNNCSGLAHDELHEIVQKYEDA